MPCSLDFKRYLSKFKSTDLNQVISGKCGRISVYKAFNPWIEIRLQLHKEGKGIGGRQGRMRFKQRAGKPSIRLRGRLINDVIISSLFCLKEDDADEILILA